VAVRQDRARFLDVGGVGQAEDVVGAPVEPEVSERPAVGLRRSLQSSGSAERDLEAVRERESSSLAPEGKGTLVVQTAAYLDYADRWHTGPGLARGAAYRDCKRRYADILLDRVERALALGLRKHIEVMEVATPVTYWRHTGNRDGSIMGARPTRRNIRGSLRHRIAHHRTPVRNLLLGGQWAEYGGGAPAAVKAGTNASLLVLKQTNPRAFADLREVMDRE